MLFRSLADGWVPFGLSPGELAAMLARADLPEGFEVVLTPDAPLDPSGAAAAAVDALGALEEAGATAASVRIAAESASHYVEQLHALAQLRR